jgi:hypothetical protein
MAPDRQTDSRQPNQAARGVRGMANDSMPSNLRKFKPTAPLNYKSPEPVRVPDPPRPKKEN